MSIVNNAVRKVGLVLLILMVVFNLFNTSSPGATNVVQAATPPRWKPVDHRAEQAYWAKRRGNITPDALANAQAVASALPQASALPAVQRRGPLSGRVAQASTGTANTSLPPNNYAWHPIGPSPITLDSNTNIPRYSGRVTTLAIDSTTSGRNTVIYLGAANGGVWKTTNNGGTWTPLTDTQPYGAIGAIAIDPSNHNTIYAGMGEANQSGDSYFGGGILKSTDGGTTWTVLGATNFANCVSKRCAAFEKIIVNPHNSNQVWAASTIGLFYSTNGGGSWTQKVGGNGWTISTPPANIDDLAIDATDPNWLHLKLYATVRGVGLFKSTDAGVSWSKLTTGLSPSQGWNNRSVIAVAPSNPQVVYVMVTNNNSDVYVPGSYNGGFYTINGGTNWFSLPSLDMDFVSGDGGVHVQGWYDLYIAVDPRNDNILYGGGVDVGVTTGARTCTPSPTTPPCWQNITNVYNPSVNNPIDNSGIHPDEHAIAFPPCVAAPCPLYVGNDGGVFYSSNTTTTPGSNVTWSNLNSSGLAITEFTGGDLDQTFVNSRLALGGTQDNGTVMYTNNPIWPRVWVGDGGFTQIQWDSPHTMYTENPFGDLQKSTDGGATWNLTINGYGGHSVLFYMPYQLDRSSDNHLVAGLDAVFESLDGAGTWHQSSQTLPGDVFSAVTVAPSDSTRIYGGTYFGNLWMTTQGNTTAQKTYTEIDDAMLHFKGRYINQVTVDSSNENIVYVALGNFFDTTHGGGILKGTSANNGATWTWTDITGTLPVYPVNSVVTYYAGTTRVIVVGTDYGVYFTTNEGTTWTQLNQGLPHTAVVQLSIDAVRSTLMAWTHGRGAFYVDIPDSVGGTGDTVGVFRSTNTTFYLRNSLTTGVADIQDTFGLSTDIPVAGDWNGDGIDTVGIYRSNTGEFFLTDSNAQGAPVVYHFVLGNPGDIPMVGDWTGRGRDGVGVFRPSNGLIYLKNNLTTGFADYTMVLGIPNDVGVAGDWTGKGFDSPGVWRPSNSNFYETDKVCNCSVFADHQATLGIAGDLPIIGDWTHSGRAGTGVFRPSNGLIYLRNDPTTSGFADISFVLGIANDQPVAGHWNTAAPFAANPGAPSAQPTAGPTQPGPQLAPTFIPSKK